MGAGKSKTTETKPTDGPPKQFLAEKVTKGEIAEAKVQKTFTQDKPEQVHASLLDASTLNPDAEPFHPGKAAADGQAAGDEQNACQDIPLIAHAPISKRIKDQPTSDANDPDWLQYLSKKFESAPKTPCVPVQGRNPGHGRLHSAKAANVPGYTPGGIRRPTQAVETETKIGNSPNVLRTSEYLQMLKDARSTNSSTSEPRKAEKPPIPMSIASHGNGQTQVGNSSLAQMWLTAFKKNPQLCDETAEEKEKTQALEPQDDILVERLTADRDIAEELYWSDCDSNTYQKARRIEHKCKHKPAAAHLFSGNLSQRVPNAKLPGYVMQDLTAELDRTTAMLLLRLQRFNDQRRTLQFKEGTGRRFIIGMKEVFRRTKQHAVKCLVIAPDIDEASESGGIDDRVREMLAFAYQNDITVIFALSRAGLGRALGKNLNISIVGLIDLKGCQDLFDEATKLSSSARLAWLQRAEGEAIATPPSSTTVPKDSSISPEPKPIKTTAKSLRGGTDNFSDNGKKAQKELQPRYEKYDYNGYNQHNSTSNYYGSGYGGSYKNGYKGHNSSGYRGSYAYDNQDEDTSYGYGGASKWHNHRNGGVANSWYGK